MSVSQTVTSILSCHMTFNILTKLFAGKEALHVSGGFGDVYFKFSGSLISAKIGNIG